MRPAIPTHNATACIWRRNHLNGDIEFLVVVETHRSANGQVISRPETKFPGGGNRFGEPVIVTLQREVLEETYLSFPPSKAEEIWRQGEEGHVKYGFLIPFDECFGELRKTTFIEDGDEVAEPRFVKARTLQSKIISSQRNLLGEIRRKLGI